MTGYPRGMLRVPMALCAVLAIACGPAANDESSAGSTSGGEISDVAANQNAPPPEGPRAGSSAENPIVCCGPQESYRTVASYECPDGSAPLGGDPDAGRTARLGSVGANSTGHIIDHYQVPCASGPVDVYVDMYGCAEWRRRLGAK